MIETPLKILLLDDDEDEFLIVKRLLAQARHSYSLEWTPNVDEALMDMRRRGHDAYLVDYRLGVLTGVEVIGRAIEEGADGPMILLTGAVLAREDQQIDLEALRVGAADYLDKQGLTPENLERSVRYAKERAYSGALRESLGRAQEEGSRLQAALTQVENQARRLRLLAESSTLFSGEWRDLDATLLRVARRCADVLGDSCTISLLGDEGADATVAAYQHVDAETQRLGDNVFLGTVPLDQSITGKVVVPLRASGQILGTLAMNRSSRENAYTTDDQDLLQDIADRAALAIQNAMFFREQLRAREAIEKAAERTGRLQATTSALAQVLTPGQVGHAVMEHGLAAFGAWSGVMYLVTADGQQLRRLAVGGMARHHLDGYETVPLSFGVPLTTAVREQKAFFFESREQLLDEFPELPNVGLVPEVQAGVTLPLLIGERALGGISLSFTEPRTFSPEEREFAKAIAQQCAQSMDRAMLAESERRAKERASFLSEASALLASSLDYQTVLENLAKLAVPKLGDWCSVEMVDGDSTRQVAVVHADPGKVGWAKELPHTYPPNRSQPRGVYDVLRTGRPVLCPEITADLLTEAGFDEDHLEIVRQVGMRSAIAVPLIAGGKPLGALTLAWVESGRRYDERDLDFMMEVAHRAALAIENARLYRDLQVAVQVRDEFLAIAGHELNTPLAALLIQLEGLERSAHKQACPPRLKERLGKASGAAWRLKTLVAELLDVSRITAGRLNLEPEPVRLDELVQEVAGRFAETALRAQSPISLEAEPNVVGLWDRPRLDQVVTNLVSNAIKYGHRRPVEIEVRREGGHAVLRVRDHGIGIAPEQQRIIFERFERAVAAREYGGLGLGLWIARQVVEATGGCIGVESTPGQGATFTVKLPLKKQQDRHAPQSLGA